MMTLSMIYQVLTKAAIVASALGVFILGLVNYPKIRGSRLSVVFGLFLSSFLLVTNASVIIEEDVTEVLEKVECVVDFESLHNSRQELRNFVSYIDFFEESVELSFHYNSPKLFSFQSPYYILYCRLMLDKCFF